MFNIITDPIVRDIDRVNKSVDDVLSQMLTVQEVYDKLALVLPRVIRLKIAVSTSKFFISTRVKYGEFVLQSVKDAEVRILPDPSVLEQLMEVATPTTKTGVKSLLGLLNTLRSWSQSFSAKTKIF